jgi:tetratricopeptide (TPR) repeat protein
MQNKPIGFIVVLTTLIFWALPILAAPSVSDVEALISKRDLAGARAAIEQVLQEKPSSAKAYYLYAQTLHAQGHQDEARKALGKAELLSPRLDFANPKYLAKLKGELGIPATNNPASAKSTWNFAWSSLLFPLVGLGAIVLGIVVVQRTQERKRRLRDLQMESPNNPIIPRKDEPLDRLAGLHASSSTGPAYGPSPSSGGSSSGLAGTATGFLAGMAAGTLLDNLLNRGHSHEEHSSAAYSPESPPLRELDAESKASSPSFDIAALGDDWSDNGSASNDMSTDFDASDSSDW